MRSYWGVLMRSGAVKKDHPEIQIHNVVTLATRIRIIVLRVSFLCFIIEALFIEDFLCKFGNVLFINTFV